MEKPPIIANFTRKNELAMNKIIEEIEISDSPALRLVRLSYIRRVGALLGIMINEKISSRKLIVDEFHTSYDTIRRFLKIKPTIKFETIAKFCYIIGYYLHKEYKAAENYKSKKHIKDRDVWLDRIKQLQRQYGEIYGPGAEAVEDLIKKNVDLRQFANMAK